MKYLGGGDVRRFDEWAPTYDESWLQEHIFEPVHQATLEAVVQEVKQPARVLDIGCGTGRLLRAVATRFPDTELVGIDPAATMVEQAEASPRSNVPIRALQARAEDLPFPDDRFDLVLSTMSFHHWTNQQRALCEISRVLTPEGRFTLTDAVVRGVGWLFFALWRTGRFHSQTELTRMFERAGLRIVSRRWVPDVHSNGNGVQVTTGRVGSEEY